MFLLSLLVVITNDNQSFGNLIQPHTVIKTNLQNKQLLQAQNELNIAMQYINRVSFKSLASVNNKGIQPAVIKPMAKSMASI